MRKRILAIGLTLAVLATAVVWFMQPHVALAADNNGSHLCLNDGSGQCLDLKDDTFSNGQPIIWYNINQGKGLGWNLSQLGVVQPSAPFTDTKWDTRYNGDAYYYLEKTTATGHNGCIGVYAALLEWKPCGAINTRWVWSTYDFLVNIDATNYADVPELAGSFPVTGGCGIGNGSNAKVVPLGASCAAQFNPNSL